ncbi:MAG: EamA family transporter RarD [Actinomycetota bacterium]
MNRGIAIGLTAYVLWGLSPIFWRLGQGSSVDIMTFRVLSTFALLVAIQFVRDRAAAVRAAAAVPGVKRAMVASAVLLSTNWLAFIWAVNTDRVLEASLGYFLNPLVSVVLGVTVLGERLRAGQWAAIAVAAAGVAWLSIDLGSLPWVSLFLAITFALYGLIRKTAAVESLDGLSIEVSVMVPVGVVALIVLSAGGDGVNAVDGLPGWIWVAGAGVMTSTPLLLFGFAARQIPLWTIGVLQYVTPTIQFLLGVLAYDEDWSGGQVVGYSIIWVGLAAFAAEGVTNARRSRTATEPIRR